MGNIITSIGNIVTWVKGNNNPRTVTPINLLDFDCCECPICHEICCINYDKPDKHTLLKWCVTCKKAVPLRIN